MQHLPDYKEICDICQMNNTPKMGESKKSVNSEVLWLTVSFTFLSCCFGSGLLAIPSIAVKMGIVPFVLMNIFAVGFSYFCFNQILKSQQELDCQGKTLTQMISLHYGKVWLFFFDLSIIFCLLPISYIAVSADYFRNFLIQICKVEVMNNKGWVIGMKFITCLCVMYPLSLIKTIKVLNYVASLSIVFVFTSVFFVFIKFCIWKSTKMLNGKEHPSPVVAIWPSSALMIPDVLTYICMFFSLYSMHASIVCIMHEYRTDFGLPTKVVKKQLSRAIFYITLPIAFVVYTAYGLIGVFMFDQVCPNPEDKTCIMVNPNVLLTFENDIAATVIELLFSIVVFVSFPCMLYPIRKSVLQFTKLDWINPDTFKGYAIYNAVGLAITLVCLFVAVFLDDISQIQSFTANLLGIILYALSGVMLWYKRGQKPIISPIKSEEPTEEQNLVDENVDNAELVKLQEPSAPIPRSKTIIFWLSTIALLLVNLTAISCQIYTWVRPKQ